MSQARFRVEQGGTEDEDHVSAIIVGRDGGVVLTGYSTGTYGEPNVGEEDFVVFKLDGDGSELWRWQVIASVQISEHMGKFHVLSAYVNGTFEMLHNVNVVSRSVAPS